MPLELENYGSIDAAIAAFPSGWDGEEPVAVSVPDPEAVSVEEKAPVVEAKAKEAAPAEDDEDWLEFPAAEEGKEPERYKVSEVFDGYKRAQTLEAELAEARKAQPLPDDMREQLEATVAERGRYMQALQTWQVMSQPKQPDLELLNEASTKYDPPAYYKAVNDLQANQANQRKVHDELQRLGAMQAEQQENLSSAMFARERSKLLEIWPEMKDTETANGVRTSLEKHYGIDRKTLSEVLDSRFYAVAKDALAYRAQQAKQAEAVKVVRAKPKLIPGGARSSSNGSNTRATESMAALQKSGSIEAAMAALDNYKQFG